MAKIKICLDAGHYGKYNQSPAIKTYYESEMNWKLHLKLKTELETYGVEVITTRTNQAKDLELRARGKASNGCDLFLSIHSNATGSTVNDTVDYVAVYHLVDDASTTADDKSKAIAKLLAPVIANTMGVKQGSQVLTRKASSDKNGDGVLNDNYYGVLNGARLVNTPGLILEHSFHTNTKTTKWLLEDANLSKLAVAEAKVIADYFGLKKQTNNGTTSVKTYKAVTDLPTYSNAADAKAKKSARGTYAKGVYYIFNKYPDGVSGMLNITKDTTGNTAGAWINPEENVEKIVEQKLYRVRKTWADSSSQKGAFEELANAKTCCQVSGKDYKVFDWNGKEVYAYIAPVQDTKLESASVAVYDLDYPQKHLIVSTVRSSNIDKEACTKAIVSIKNNNTEFNVHIAKVFFELAPRYGIDPMRAIAQSILETGWFKFVGSSVKAEQNNYCGLGATGGGSSGASFNTIEDGVRAQLQHLFAYGCKDALPNGETIIDPRFSNVTRGIAPYWEQLAGRWAVPGFDGTDAEAAMKAGNTYGQKIATICDGLNATIISDSDIKLYFTEESKNDDVTPEVPRIETETTQKAEEKLDVHKINLVSSLLEKILSTIIKLFNKS